MARVCMVAYTVYPADTRIRREAEALVQRGDEVDIVCPDADALGGRRGLNGVRIHPVLRIDYSRRAQPLAYLWRYLVFLLAAGVSVLRLHLRQRYDLIQVHTMPDFLVFAGIGPRLLGAKVLLDVHDLVPELYASKFSVPESHWLVRALRLIERLSIRFADRAVAVHRPHLDALVDHGNPREKFTILMNLPDRALFLPVERSAGESKFMLIYHGTVGSRHGLDVAVRAVASARDMVPGLELRIIGDGDYFPEVARLVDELDVAREVRLEQGFVPAEELVSVLNSAAVGIVPILDDPFTRFMLPVKLLEYLSLGIPAITSDTSTIRAYCDERTVCFCRPGDADDLAAKIVALSDDRAAREQLSFAGIEFSKQYNWEAEKEKYYELVDSLLATQQR